MTITAVVRTTATVEEATEILAVIRTKARVSRPASAFCSVPETDIWFPVPPNTTTLPPPPPITTNPNPRPPNSVELPPDFDDSDLCYIFQDLLPDDSPPVYAEEMEPAGILLPYNETVPLIGRTRLRLAVREYPYALVLPTEEITAVVRTVIDIPTYLVSVEGGAFSATGQAAGLYWNRKLAGEAGTFALSGFGSGFIRDYLIGTNAGTFVATGQDAGLRYDRLPLAAEVGEFVLQGQDAGRFLGKTLTADAGSFTLSGESAGLLRPERVVTGDAGAFTLSGQAANLVYTSPAFSILTYTGNGTTTNAVTGVGFEPALVWTKRLTTSAEGHNIFSPQFQNIFGGSNYAFGTSTSGAGSGSALCTFESDGFTLKTTNVSNTSGASYIAFAWKNAGSSSSNTDGSITVDLRVNQAIEMSMFSYLGSGAAATIGHGLSGAPDLVFIQDRSFSQIAKIGGTVVGDSFALTANSTSARSSATDYLGFSSTTISLSASNFQTNRTNSRHIGFAFRSKAGTSKIATFSGNGSSTQAVTGLGFAPKWVMVKSLIGGTSNWVIFVQGRDSRLFADTTAVESATDYITFDGDGFTLESGASVNSSGVTYLYMAFA